MYIFLIEYWQDDYSPLIVAATACDPKMIQLLLNADVPLDFPDAVLLNITSNFELRSNKKYIMR